LPLLMLLSFVKCGSRSLARYADGFLPVSR